MGVLNTIYPGGMAASIPLRQGITALPDLVVTKDGTITATTQALGASMKNRMTDDSQNADGKEVVDERWIEANKGAGWVPIGGGPAGATVEITATTTFELRVNIPAGASTSGDFEANLEIYYIE